MKVHLSNVRLSFPQLWEAKMVQGQGEPKFSAAFLFPKDHAVVKLLSEAVLAAATEKWSVKAEEILKVLKAADKLAVHDGDSKSDYDGYAGNYFLNASCKVRPLVIGQQREALAAADGKPYSGCYVNAVVEIWAQDNQFGKRVNASLMGVQYLRDGDRLAGGAIASADDFQTIPQEGATAPAEAGAASLF